MAFFLLLLSILSPVSPVVSVINLSKFVPARQTPPLLAPVQTQTVSTTVVRFTYFTSRCSLLMFTLDMAAKTTIFLAQTTFHLCNTYGHASGMMHQASRDTHYTSNVTHPTFHIPHHPHHPPHATRPTSHITHHKSHITPPTPPLPTCDSVLLCSNQSLLLLPAATPWNNTAAAREGDGCCPC